MNQFLAYVDSRIRPRNYLLFQQPKWILKIIPLAIMDFYD